MLEPIWPQWLKPQVLE